MRAGKIVALVAGAVAALVACALVLAGGAVLMVHGIQRDDDGFYTAGPERLRSDAYAITAEDVDLVTDARDGDWMPGVDVGTVRVTVESLEHSSVFVGIARQADIDAYLAGSAHDELADISLLPSDRAYRHGTGTAEPSPPAAQSFWVASAVGPGEQTLLWDIESGEWGVVFMNADGSPDVKVDARVGVKTDLFLPVGIGLLVGGLVTAALAVGLVLLALRQDDEAENGERDSNGDTLSRVAAGRGYPVRLDGALDPHLSRGLWLVKWFLAIPHMVVLAFLWAAFGVLTVAAGVAVVFTGRYPRAIFRFNEGVLRWTWRVTFYAFTLGTDRYPPFSLESDPTYPADLHVEYPQRLSRGLVLVKWWLLALPHYLVLAAFGGGAGWWAWSQAGDSGIVGAGLVGILVLVAAVALLFSGKYPQAVFDFVMGMQRWTYRVYAYAALMRDEYPPFRLDTGGTDPGSMGSIDLPPAPDRGGELVGAR